MPGNHSAQGTTVTFDGVPIGDLTGLDWECSASLSERTSIDSEIVGQGDNARVRRQYDATTLEPPRLSITFFGPPSYSADDAGLKGALVFNAPEVSLSGDAILVSFSHSGRPNQWTTGSAVFQFVG